MMSEEQAACIERMRGAGKSYEQIGRRIGKSGSAVRWYCLRNGIDSPRGMGTSYITPGSVNVSFNGRVWRRYSAEEDAALLAMRKDGVGLKAIGLALGRRHSSVLARLVTLAARDAASAP